MDNPNDPIRAHIWEYIFFWNEVKAGHLPLWNPYVLGGTPLIESNAFLGIGLPDLVNIWLNPIRGFSVAIALYILLGQLGMYALLRNHGRHWIIATTLSFAYGFNGIMVSQLAHLVFLGTMAFLPFVILFIERHFHSGNRKYVILGGIFFGFLLLKSVFQIDLFTGAVLIIYCFLQSYSSYPSYSAARVKPIASCLLILTIGVLIGVARWLPSIWMYLTRDGNMGGLLSGYSWRWYGFLLFPVSLIQMFFANNMVIKASAVAPLQPLLLIYVGTLSALLLLWYSCVRYDRRTSAWFWILVFVCLVTESPLVHYFYHRIYIVAMPFLILGVSEAWSALLGTQFWEWRRHGLRIFTCVCFALSVFVIGCEAFGLVVNLLPDAISTLVAKYNSNSMLMSKDEFTRLIVSRWGVLSPGMIIPAVILFCTVAAVYVVAKNRLSGCKVVFIFSIVLIMDMVYFAKSSVPAVDLQKYPILQATPAIKVILESEQPRSLSLHRVAIWDDTKSQDLRMGEALSFFGLSTIHGYTSMFPFTVAQVAGYNRFSTLENPMSGWPYLDVQGVRWIITPGPRPEMTRMGMELRYSYEVTIYENIHAFPKAWLVADACILNREDLRKEMMTSMIDFRQQVLLEMENSPSIEFSVTHPESLIPVEIREYRASWSEFLVKTTQQAFLVINDTYSPGWKGTIDGRRTPVYRVNGAMRGILIPPGEHVVRMWYNPIIYIVGFCLSVIGVLVAVCLLVAGYKDMLTKRNYSQDGDVKV